MKTQHFNLIAFLFGMALISFIAYAFIVGDFSRFGNTYLG